MPTIAQPGDVVLVRFPFTDISTAKLRPAVVLATRGDDLTIVGIFSGSPHPPRETWILLSFRWPDSHDARTPPRPDGAQRGDCPRAWRPDPPDRMTPGKPPCASTSTRAPSTARPLDNLSSERVRLEAEAVVALLAAVEDGIVTWIGSDYLDFEVETVPVP